MGYGPRNSLNRDDNFDDDRPHGSWTFLTDCQLPHKKLQIAVRKMGPRGPQAKRRSGGAASWFACFQFFCIVFTFVLLAVVFITMNLHAHGQVRDKQLFLMFGPIACL